MRRSGGSASVPALVFALVCLLASACDGDGGGADTAAAPDVPSAADVSAGEDIPVADDVPAVRDVPGRPDAPAEPDVPEPANERIPLVFQVDMNPGLTRNCVDTRPDAWLEPGALEDPTATAWLVGGVHVETPICGAERVAHCLSHAERDALHRALGEWQPNRVAMHDDGLEGDAVAGDGVYAVTLEVPYWDPADAPDLAGVRLGYKYTWGHAGDLWTGTEEWPGNQRLLELVDVNGDGRIVRHDLFGDETSNKDRQNLREPARGGCGVVVFEQERATTPEFGDCVMDSREAQIDTDGDCELDAWPE